MSRHHGAHGAPPPPGAGFRANRPRRLPNFPTQLVALAVAVSLRVRRTLAKRRRLRRHST
eukprot:2828789-Prymnesium_polylepis.1